MAASKTYVSLCRRHKANDMNDKCLVKAKLCNYDLHEGSFTRSILSGSDLSGADLQIANFLNANLSHASLKAANLIGTNLIGADLSGADLTNVTVDETTAGYWPVCPMEGDFIGYKKVYFSNSYYDDDVPLIAQLMVPATAERSSATTRKCRCSDAKVMALYYLNGKMSSYKKAYSNYDTDFVYTVGKTVKADSFDPDRWNECSHGIHFFMTFEEARIY